MRILWCGGGYNVGKVHQSLRTLAATAGLISPALLGIGMTDSTNTAIRWVAFGFTLMSGLALAADAVFRPRDRWRLQRRVGDALKAEAWLFVQLAGPYKAQSHTEARDAFVAASERIIKSGTQEFLEILTEPAPRAMSTTTV
jgi:hypothetical protein